MATETQTPIETLRTLIQYGEDHHCEGDGCPLWEYLADARTALEDVEALAALLQRIGYDEELSYLACPGPPNCDGSHYDTCPVALARAALAKFQGQS